MPVKKKSKKPVKKAKPVKKKKVVKAKPKKSVKKVSLKKKIVAKKKIVRAKPIVIKPKGKLLGRVVHFFDKISVAVIKLNGTLVVGDTIQIIGGETDFKQTVKSMQVNHQAISKAKPKDEIGLKVNQKVHEGYRVFKV